MCKPGHDKRPLDDDRSRSPRSWTGWIIVVLLLTTSASAAERERLLSTPELVDSLTARDFVVRERAAETLLQRRDEATFKTVVEAAQTNGETAARAIAILEAWAFETDGEFSERTERALMTLRSDPDATGNTLADGVLTSAQDVRQERAVAALRRLGAEVKFRTSQEQLNLNHKLRVLAGLPYNTMPRLVRFIWLSADWTGTDDDLWHLKRLRHATYVNVRVTNRAIDKTAVDRASAVLTKPIVEFRGAALGLSSYGETPMRVRTVFLNTPAANAGLRPNDAITHLDGKPFNSISELIELLLDYEPKQTISLTFRRAHPLTGELSEPQETSVELTGWDNMPPAAINRQ